MRTRPDNATAMERGGFRLRWVRWAAAALLAGAASSGCNTAPAAPPPKAPEVDVSLPVQEDVTDYEIFTGSVQAEKSVDLRAQVTGYLQKEPLAQEGTDVTDGEVLFKIDPSTYEAVLAQAKANTNQAATRVTSTQDVYSRDVASPSATPMATLVQDRDAMEEAKAALKAAQALERSAQLNVDFTDVKAPFTGRLSRRNVDPGNLVQANVTSLATIVQLDPIYAYFDVDERTLLRIRKLVLAGVIAPRSMKAKDLPVNLALSDENGFTYTAEDEKLNSAHKRGTPRRHGYIAIVDNQENVQTGTLRVWGEFSNPEPKVLSPGMFARIQLPIGKPHPAILIAEAALVSDQGKELLYVAGPADDKGESEVRARYVTIGSYQNGLRVIESAVKDDKGEVKSGLLPGEQVVLNGLQRVRDKAKVRVRNVVPMPRLEDGVPTAATNEQGAAAK